jgi:hypothetical protein
LRDFISPSKQLLVGTAGRFEFLGLLAVERSTEGFLDRLLTPTGFVFQERQELSAEILRLQPQPINDEPFPERYKYLAIAAITLSSWEVDSSGEPSAWRLDFARSLLSATP